MRKLLSLLSVAAVMAIAAPAFAQDDPDANLSEQFAVTPGRAQGQAPVIPVDDREDEIWVACLRLPTLADLSKERWNDVHRRNVGRRGQPIRRA